MRESCLLVGSFEQSKSSRDTHIKRALATRPVQLSPGRLTNQPEGLQGLRPSLGPEHRGPHLFMATAQTPQYECSSPGEGSRKVCAHPGVSPGIQSGIQSGDNPDHRMEGHQAGRQGRCEPGCPGPVTQLLWPVSRAVKEIADPKAAPAPPIPLSPSSLSCYPSPLSRPSSSTFQC